MLSPAAAAKGHVRVRVLSSSGDGEEDGDEWQTQTGSSKKRRVSLRASVCVTGGKATKTGMFLARAQLSTTQTGVVAAQERQSALLGKGKYRKAETVAREAPVGTLATKDMPKRKGMKGSEADFQKRFGTWMRTALSAKVRHTHAEGVLKGVLALTWRGVRGR